MNRLLLLFFSVSLAAQESQLVSITKQKEAVRGQSGQSGTPNGFFTADWKAPEPAAEEELANPDCAALTAAEAQRLTEDASRRHGVDRQLLQSVMEQESNLKPCATSTKGAMGLMQLMPDTATRFGVRDPYEPRQNVETGTRLLKDLLARYQGKVDLALSAYNAGPGRVDKEQRIPDIEETKKYVAAILARWKQRQAAAAAPIAERSPR